MLLTLLELDPFALPVPVHVLAGLVVAAFVAGWVDAVVGGGGLIQLPSLLIGLPKDVPSPYVLGTNKISSAAGTLTATITYARRVAMDWRTVVPLVVSAFVGSAIGSSLARLIPKAALTPIVLVALLVVGTYTLLKPELGLVHEPRHTGLRHYGSAAAIGVSVGAYDGLLGPGTGSFFVILMVAVLGYGFLEASAKAKIANLATNVASIVVFGLHGELLVALGLLMAAANLSGGFLGARTAIKRGNGFVRTVFLVVVGALVLKLGYDTILLL
ncbi:TSUP family transporter [Mariniluteicoccus endophyticus]